jgi:predicted dehydrogenase
MIGVGIIGYGYWGPNLLRNFSEVESCSVVSVSDVSESRLASARKRHPAVDATTDCFELIRDPRVDAVAIATPVSTHFDLAMAALRAGKHVLVEKPMCATAEEADRLVDEAARRRLILAVDHTFVYTGAVKKIRELVTNGELGEIYYYDSVRVNLGLFRHDVNVVWDLAVHDLSIIDYVLPVLPCAISATGVRHVASEPENIAYMTLYFDTSLIAHVHANWLAPVKVRRTLICGSSKMIVYDDVEPSEKVKLYDKGITVNGNGNGNGSGNGHSNGNGNGSAMYQLLVGYRAGDMWAPRIATTEALATELRHFVDCIEHNTTPITDGRAGLRVVRLLEAASFSMAERGRVVELNALGCPV